MTDNRLLWLPGVLRAAGLAVVEVPGWQDRGHPDDGPFEPAAVMFHHDASPPGDSPGALAWLISGFASSSDSNYDAQCWVDRRGVWHIVAAGRAQHAGAGKGWGAIPAGLGNRMSFGVETDHTTGEAWVPVQFASIRTGMAVICGHQRWDPGRCVVGHKEYAPGRKDDPDPVDMAIFRNQVAALMSRPAGGHMTLDADVAAAFAAVNNNIGTAVRGDTGHPDSIRTVRAEVEALTAKVDAVAAKVDGLVLGGGQLDVAALVKAINDDAAARMKG